MGVCDNFLLKDKFFEVLDEEAKKNKVPLHGTFELTPRCNFNCKMCYVHLNAHQMNQIGKELSGEEWIEIARKAKDAGMLQLCITGGEPTLHPEFPKIYRALAKMGFFITLQTNASTLNDELLALLEEYPPRDIKITLYGSNNDIYREVCGIENGFDRVDQGIQKIKALNIPMILVTTVIKQNMHDLVNIANYCARQGLFWIYTTTVHNSVRGANSQASNVAINEETATNYREDIRRMIENPVMKDEKKPCEYCKGYRNSFWVTWNGKMQFCSFMNEPNIYVQENGFEQSWEQLIAFEEELTWPKECLECEIRSICRRCVGALVARSGKTDQVNPHFCEKLKKYVQEEKEKMSNECI